MSFFIGLLIGVAVGLFVEYEFTPVQDYFNKED